MKKKKRKEKSKKITILVLGFQECLSYKFGGAMKNVCKMDRKFKLRNWDWEHACKKVDQKCNTKIGIENYVRLIGKRV